MRSLSVAPALVFPNQTACQLVQIPRVHSKFNERFLQDLLATNPELLPMAAMRQDVGSLLCVGREVSVPSGSIDNLYLSTAGYPVLVETKLWRNPQARREVLSQTLDYIKDLARRDFEWFEEQWKLHRRGTPYQDASLTERIGDLATEEMDERSFIDRVNHALHRGDILAMIVGDGIETRLQELVAHLCKDSAHLRYALALCELSFFQLGEAEADGLIVVPRIVGSVEPVQRAYVRVDVADDLAGKVMITPVAVETEHETRPVRVNLSEEDFLRSVEAAVGPELRQKIQDAYNDLIESFELEPDFLEATLGLKIPHSEGRRGGANILAFEKNGRVLNTRFLKAQLERWELRPDLVERITTEYWCALHSVCPSFPPDGVKQNVWRNYVPFATVLPKWPEIRAVIGEVVKRVRSEMEVLRGNAR